MIAASRARGIRCAPAAMPQPADPVRVVARLAEAIEAHGYAVAEHFLRDATLAALRARAEALDAAGALRAAGVGRGAQRIVDGDVRGDRILWLDSEATLPEERELQTMMERVRVALNRALVLGLLEFEVHYAVYPAGARYAAHRDRFRDDDARVLSCVLYLNDDWRAEDGGALRLHLDAGAVRDVQPAGGTLVTFLSERFVHEVLPATRTRYSLAGWFRRR